ncbi:MAG TPA: RNA polymerase sigma factor [Kofleriaceae bacterium]
MAEREGAGAVFSTSGGLLREDGLGASVIEGGATIEDLSKAHGEYLRGLARRLCRDQYDPDDLVQDTLLRALSSPIPSGANVRAWLARVMQNRFIDYIRRRQARREDQLPELSTVTADEQLWWQSLSSDDVLRALERLPEDQRAAFRMFAFEGKSYTEIADAQRIAKATVGTRILRARLRIREILAEERCDG